MCNRVLLAVGLAGIGAGVGHGQDFIRNAFGVGKKSASPVESPILRGESGGQIPSEYLLTQKNGPFHIFVASYVGERGVEYALRLATELRSKHGLEAYLHNYREKEPFHRPDAKQLEEMRKSFHGKAPRFPQLKTPLLDHWVVVVGNFAAMENDRAYDAAMRKLKRLNRESFSPEVAVELRWGTEANRKNTNELVGLRGTANPLRPREEKLDLKMLKLLKEMNDVSEEPYSIYQLKAPCTMCVYKFSAATGIAKREKKSFFSPEKQVTGMVAAANNARIFCKLLRDMGHDAYVFHSDIASCVCINGYQGRNDPKWIEDYKKFAKMDVMGVQFQPDLIPTPQDPTRILNAAAN